MLSFIEVIGYGFMGAGVGIFLRDIQHARKQAAKTNNIPDNRTHNDTVEKIQALIAHLDTVHVDRLYVSKDYTLGDLRNDLKTAIGET